MVVKRGTITVCNIIFPPLAVFLLCGAGEDLLINSVLFLLAVIPSHIHGFYISFTYFQRKRKVRKGQYPGNWRPMIFSEKIQNGGAPSSDVREYKKEKALKTARKQESKLRKDTYTKRLLGKVFRKNNATYSSVPHEESYASTVSSHPSSSRRPRNSFISTDAYRISRQKSHRHSHKSEAGQVSQVPRKRTSVRSNPHGNRRSQVVEYLGHTNSPKRYHSNRSNRRHANSGLDIRNSHSCRVPSTDPRSSISGQSSEVMADYLSRPTLPSRPGTSYRDDINRWRQSIPLEAN